MQHLLLFVALSVGSLAFEINLAAEDSTPFDIQRGKAVMEKFKRGEVKAPLLLWGAYLWANGNTPRKLDGFAWPAGHFREDHLHPNTAGCQQITKLLLNFFKTDAAAARWFNGGLQAD